MKHDYHQEILALAFELDLSVRFDTRTGAVTLYEHLGEWECPEQAFLAIKKMMKE